MYRTRAVIDMSSLICAGLVMILCLPRSGAVQCGGLHVLSLETPEVTISSPGFTNGLYYPDRCQCQWTIIGPEPYVLKVEFSAFSIEESQTCQFDKLIFDGTGSCDFKSPRRHCGDIPPEPITSSGNILCLRFISDSHIRDSGFRLTIKIFGNVLR
ncbi:procollagen c-endopeptidase enhancer 1 [Plakobranchus ocellatus]|uniref:Procollagen c-endopeptidase enhancer 1 n=1 Tax=Plakobranchus ocellatus TaxID=259542 RepID=A0AAV4BL04_9GAST|nr:procollagen c-endopeptidase enhancer 1 [Plakobranchus ocellatus]